MQRARGHVEIESDAASGARDALSAVQHLRSQLERVQGLRLDAPMLPVPSALESLLPGGGLRPGAVYALSTSASLLQALLAGPSRQGTWCGVVGMPEFGVEAAECLGVELSRVVLIPDPGPRWVAVAATIAEVLPVVAVRPAGRVSDGEMSRLAARLRDRDAVLLVQGEWPQAEATIRVDTGRWSGLGRGHGYLADREVTVSVTSRRWPVPRRGRMLLGGQTPVTAASPAVAVERDERARRLEAVG